MTSIRKAKKRAKRFGVIPKMNFLSKNAKPKPYYGYAPKMEDFMVTPILRNPSREGNIMRLIDIYFKKATLINNPNHYL